MRLDQEIDRRTMFYRNDRTRTNLRLGQPLASNLITIILLLPASLIATTAPARAQDATDVVGPTQRLQDTGPLPVRAPFILSLGFLDFQPMSATVLPKGSWEARATLTGASNFASSPAIQHYLIRQTERHQLSLSELRDFAAENGGRLYFTDAESYRTEFVLERGLGHGAQAYVVVPVVSAVAGRLDGLIEQFHRSFGLGQEGRTGIPRDSFTVYLVDGETELYIGEPPGISLGDISAGGKLSLTTLASGVELTLNSELKLPTGSRSRLAGSGSLDFGTQLIASWHGRRNGLHGAAGVRLLGPNKLLSTRQQTVLSGLVAWELAFGGRTSALLQLTASQGLFRQLGLDLLDDTALQGTIGVKRAIRRQNVAFFAVTENLDHFGNTPDVGFHFGWIRSLDDDIARLRRQ